MDPVETIVDALVAAINAGDYSEELTATSPDFLEVDQTDHDLHVAVFPREDIAESWWTADTDQSEISIAVLIRQTLDPYTAARAKALRALSRSIRNVIRDAHPLTQLGDYNVNLESIAHAPLWAPELLRTEQLFLSILLVTYKTEYEV